MPQSRIAIRSTSPAFTFVLTMGIVNLFADITYEGGGSINGPFMASLGAGAAVVSITAGTGEFLGYALRSVSGYLPTRPENIGPSLSSAMPSTCLPFPPWRWLETGRSPPLSILAERIGRALRKPTVEAMLSYTTGELGKGWVYAVNTALDEIGATSGPCLSRSSFFSREVTRPRLRCC